MGCIEDSTPALAAYRIALHYGLNVVKGARSIYNIEDVVKVVKKFYHCNDCIKPANNNFIEKCARWSFEVTSDE